MVPASITQGDAEGVKEEEYAEGDAEGAEEEEFQYGDVEAHSGEKDGPDYSIHQFIVKDEARDPEGSDDTEADAASMDAQRSAIEGDAEGDEATASAKKESIHAIVNKK